MRTTPIQQYARAKAALERELLDLDRRRTAIMDALGHSNGVHSPAPVKRKTAPTGPRNKSSLAEMVRQVAKKPMSKPEIIAAMERAGYVFRTADKINSLNSWLYTAGGKSVMKKIGGGMNAKWMVR